MIGGIQVWTRILRVNGRGGAERSGLGLWLLCGLLAACTYRGYIEEPVTLKLTWYSYLAGDDIKMTCVPGTLPRYRLVYNGHYDEQLRSYEVVGLDGGGAAFKARVLGPSRAQALLSNPLDLQDPWRWTISETQLGPESFADFAATLEANGAKNPLRGGMSLLSSEFYWIASGCRDGRFLFNAWRYGTPRFDALTFPETLLAYDRTGIEVNPPRPVDPADRLGSGRPVGAHSNDRPRPFVVKVGPGGLKGRGLLL